MSHYTACFDTAIKYDLTTLVVHAWNKLIFILSLGLIVFPIIHSFRLATTLMNPIIVCIHNTKRRRGGQKKLHLLNFFLTHSNEWTLMHFSEVIYLLFFAASAALTHFRLPPLFFIFQRVIFFFSVQSSSLTIIASCIFIFYISW